MEKLGVIFGSVCSFLQLIAGITLLWRVGGVVASIVGVCLLWASVDMAVTAWEISMGRRVCRYSKDGQ